MHKRILVATDFADVSKIALAHAVELASRDSAVLHVMFVEALHEPNEEAARASLDRLEFPAGLEVVRHVERGVSTPPAVVDYASDKQIDLIVVGSHGGRSGLARWFLGSVAQEIVRVSPIPVLVVGASRSAAKRAPFQVLAAVDFSEASMESLRVAASIATDRGGQLLAMHSIDLSKLPPYFTVELEAERRQHVRRELADWMRAAKAPSGALAIVCDGPADDRIVETARDHAVDLIVMGASGHGVVERLLVGSVTDRVLRAAPCPVLAHRNSKRHGSAKRMERAA